MSEPQLNTPETEKVDVRLVGVYLKNASLETAHSPLDLAEGLKPEINFELKLHINPLNEHDEVVLDLQITARDGGRLLYLLKLQQAGCMALSQVSPEQKAFFLHTVCAQMIYPYVCHAASTLVAQAGFPSLHLTPIDFTGLYLQQKASEDAKVTAQPAAPNGRDQPGNKWARLDTTVPDAEPKQITINE